MTDARYWVGADENGMGPRLGPLVVTAVLARVQPEAERIVTRKPRGALGRRLGDSKGLVAHGNIALAEAWTRALVAKGCGKHGRADDPDALLDAVSFEDRDTLTEPCPRSARAQCWHLDGERFTDPELMGDTLKQVTGDLKRPERRSVEIVAGRS